MDAPPAAPPSDRQRSTARCAGREAELALLEGLQIAALADGRGRIAWLSGPAGIGKSVLLDALRDRLAARGVLVADGSCVDGAPPWQPVVQMVAQVVRALADSTARALLLSGSEVLSALRGQDHHVPNRPHGHASATPEGREALCERAVAFLAEASRAAPLCLIVHDLHHADDATRALLSHLARTRVSLPELDTPGGEHLRGLLVVSSRAEEAGLLEGAAVTPLRLGPLDESGVRDFLQSESVVRRIAAATGGRPRALEALLEGAVPDAERLPDPRVTALPEAARALLEALAVLGRPASAELLRQLCGADGDPAPLSGLLDQLMAARLVLRRSGAGEPRFEASPSVAEALRLGLDDARVTSLRLAAGRHLAASLDGADRIAAAELLLAANAGEEAVEAARGAGADLEARYGHERAATLYRAAHAVTTRDPVRAELEARLVEIQKRSGDYRGALADARRLLARQPDDPAALRAVGQLHLLLDEYAPAREALSRARESALRNDDRLELARVIAGFAEVCLLDGRHADAIAECAIGLHAIVEGVPDADAEEAVRLRLELRNTLGKVHLAEGRYPEAEAHFAQNLAEARAAAVPWEEARACINQGIVRLRLGDHGAAAGCYQAALKIATACDDQRHRAFCLQNLAVLAHWESQYGTALRCFHEAVTAFKRIGQAGRLAWLALDLASLYLDLSCLERAQSMARLAERLGDRSAGATVRHKRAVIAARLCRAQGDLEGARAILDEALEEPATLVAPELRGEAKLLRGWTALDAGDPTGAAREAELAARDLATTSPASRARLSLLEGEVRLALGEVQGARRALLEAAEGFLRYGDLDGEWRAHFALGRVAAASFDHVEAERRYRRAAQLDARLRERVPEELRPHLAADPTRRALARSLSEPVTSAERAGEALLPEARRGDESPPGADRFERLIGRHPRMRQVYSLVERVARHSSVVLIRGESGTGKELIAEAIHLRSARAGEPLVKVNCGALVETLLLSELFGHERGAFTGAVARKKGRFEAADRGTIFLDEIGDISPQTQAALLRVIQEREFERVGSTTPIRVDVRIVCATNRDLEAMVAAGEFREDLYYRLKGIQIDLPPLRDRAEDVPLIAADILARVVGERGDASQAPRSLSPEVLERLGRYRWPGNVRELENVIRSVALFADGQEITLDDLRDHPEILAAGAPARPAAPALEWRRETVERAARGGLEVEGAAWQRLGAEGIGLRELQERIEIECITRALAESGGNITRAAEILKMKRPRLSQLIKEHGIALPRDEGTSCGTS